jgi:hypothetical protein
MNNSIVSATEATLGLLKIKGASITVTPKVISIENLTKVEAEKIDEAFTKAGMRTLGVTDLAEIEMGEGFEISIVI